MNKILLELISFFSVYLVLFKYNKNSIIILFVMLIIDYLTGITNSLIKGNNFSFKKAVNGILKKINYIYIIIACFSFDLISKNIFSINTEISQIVIIWLILNEIISTLANITNSNILPKNLITFIKNIKGAISEQFKYK